MKALIDGDIIVYRVGFAADKESEKIARSRLDSFMVDLMMFGLPDEVDKYDGFLTDTQPSNFRYGFAVTYPYKGNRSGAKPVHYDYLRTLLVQDYGFDVVYGEEADDAISKAATADPDTIIVTIDKDLDQVPGRHYNFVTRKYYEVTEQEGIRNFYKQLLTGDRVDNIVGLNRVGPLTAVKILQGRETPEDMFKAVVEAYRERGEAYDRIIENGRLLWLRRYDGELWGPPLDLRYTLPSATE